MHSKGRRNVLISPQIGVPYAVFFFNCPKEIARNRVTHRSLPHRGDDESLFERRYTEFCLNNPAVIEYYRERQLLIEVRESRHRQGSADNLQIDTSGPTSVSYQRFLEALQSSGIVERGFS